MVFYVRHLKGHTNKESFIETVFVVVAKVLGHHDPS